MDAEILEKLAVAAATDVGRTREHNEDRYLVAKEGRLVAVADGMGGHNAGEIAAEIALKTLAESFEPDAGSDGPSGVSQPLAATIRAANKLIREAAAADRTRRGMGTTIVAAAFCKGSAVVAHAGDSRAYLLRKGALLRLTRDHSLREAVAAMAPTPALSAEALADLPSNVILRALGPAESVSVETSVVSLEAGDRLLLCSDGLTGMLSDDAIRDLLVAEVDKDKACEALIREANEAGGTDNITAVLVDVGA